MLVLAEHMQPTRAPRLESTAPSSRGTEPLDQGIRRHLQAGTTGRVDILEQDRHLGVILMSRGQVVWVHCNAHPEPFSQRLARDIGMSAQELGHLLHTYPANKLDLVQVMAQNAPLGPVELREVLFEHSSAHLHALLRSHPQARAELHPSQALFATPYEFDYEELVAMGDLTAAGDAVAMMWDVLASHPDIADAWIMQDEVPEDLHAQWPWLEAGLGALRGEMPSFEWFGTVEDRGFVLLGEEPFVVIASLKGNPSSEAFERVLSALTAARTCLTGLALERVIRRIASAHPGSLLAARLVHEQGGRSASWHHPAMSESLGQNFGEQAQAAEVFHSVSMELLSQGLGKGLQRHEDYDLHVRCRGGLGIVLMARSGSDISF